MQLTRMPSGAHSTATHSLNATMPARAAQVCATWCRPRGGDDDADDASRPRSRAPVPGDALHHVEGAVQVGVDHRAPALLAEVERGLGKLATGAVDQHVDLAMAREEIGEELIHRAHARGCRARSPRIQGRGRRAPLRTRASFSGAASAQHHPGSEACGDPGAGAADAAAGSGDDDRAAAQQLRAPASRGGRRARHRTSQGSHCRCRRFASGRPSCGMLTGCDRAVHR